MKYDELISRIRQKRLIFTVTTGRSGTAYLSSIFGFSSKVHAVHEPSPEFADVLRSVQTCPDAARKFLLEKKLPAILQTAAGIYLETSHLVCKGFLEPMLELDIVPDLIIHRRNPRDVALSMFKMGTIPGRSSKGLRFYLSPSDPNVFELGDWEELHDYQLCYWYCLEIERRAQHYKKLIQQHGAMITETTLTDLKTFIGLTKCFAELDLKVKSPYWLSKLRFLRNIGVKVNESIETKKDIDVPPDLIKLENEVVKRLECHELHSGLIEMTSKIV